MKQVTEILEHFAYSHLPVHLQATSKKFYEMAMEIEANHIDNEEKTMALRKLLECKDCTVRSARITSLRQEN